MAEEGLKIKIGADVRSAVTSLNTLNTSLNKTTQTAANLGTTGMNNLTKGTSQASTALTNFGRVASDAPFGLIGIANNIEPLVQSFIQLRKETGSAKAAFSALATSLTGAGGLIVGISLVTSVLQFVELGFSRWGASTDKAKQKTKELKDETKDYQTILKEVTSQLSQEAANVTILVQTLKSETSTREQRNIAIKELNKIAPEIFKNLSSEKTEIDKLNVSYQNYINTLNARIKIQVLEKQLTQILEKELALNDKNNAQTKARLENEKVVTALKDQYVNSLQDKQIDKNNLLYRQWANTLTVENELSSLSKERATILDNIVLLQNEYNDSLKTATVETTDTKNGVDEIAEALKNYNNELKGINWDEQNRQIDGTKKRLELAGETLKTLYLAGVKETSDAWIQVKRDFDNFQIAYDEFLKDQRLRKINEDILDYSNEIGNYSDKVFKKSQDNIIKGLQKAGKQYVDNYKSQLKGLDDLKKKNEELAKTITNQISPAFESAFESLLKGDDPFEALRNSVKQLIIELGKAVIKSLILKAVTSAIGGPAAGQAAGAGLGFIRGDQLRGLTFGR